MAKIRGNFGIPDPCRSDLPSCKWAFSFLRVPLSSRFKEDKRETEIAVSCGFRSPRFPCQATLPRRPPKTSRRPLAGHLVRSLADCHAGEPLGVHDRLHQRAWLLAKAKGVERSRLFGFAGFPRLTLLVETPPLFGKP